MNIIIVLSCLVSAVLGLPFFEPPELRAFRNNPLFPHGRIVGGVDTDIKEVPYQIAMEFRSSHFCGGTLISENFVLTAAHCIIAPASDMSVRVGSSRRNSGGTVLPVAKTFVHPKYNEKTIDFDVAILQLGEKAPLSDSVKPVPLVSSEPEVDSNFIISGWGSTKENGLCSLALQSVSIPIVSRKLCQEAYSSYDIDISPRMICAYASKKDSCQGDSGGPAVVNGKVGGIVSWGVGCARPNMPGVYTNVGNPDVRSFIRDKTKL